MLLGLKRFFYLVVGWRHSCSEELVKHPQPVRVDSKIFTICPICKKRYIIQFASMIRELIKKELALKKDK